MRRGDKEIKYYQEIAAIMKKAIVCRISFVDGDCPYIVPVNFAVNESHLYFHSAMDGRKIDILRKNNKVCFEMDVSTEIIKGKDSCSWGMKYLSVIGFGRAFFIDKPNEKKKALDLLMEKYDGAGSFSYKEKIFKKVLVIDIRIEKISGKKSHIS
jgi:nitroimidazol reductase NimA-like FMN-containing flavoprotein (pyridoxamine 5'-phosphate oxidase superfamily)